MTELEEARQTIARLESSMHSQQLRMHYIQNKQLNLFKPLLEDAITGIEAGAVEQAIRRIRLVIEKMHE